MTNLLYKNAYTDTSCIFVLLQIILVNYSVFILLSLISLLSVIFATALFKKVCKKEVIINIRIL